MSFYMREGYPLGIIDRQPRRGWCEWRLGTVLLVGSGDGGYRGENKFSKVSA